MISSIAGPAAVSEFTVDDLGWYPVKTFWRSDEVGSLMSVNQPMWLEASEHCPDNLEVLNTRVSHYDQSPGVFEMDVLVTAKKGTRVSLAEHASFCSLRIMDLEDHQAIQDWTAARDTRQAEYDAEELPDLVDSSSDDDEPRVQSAEVASLARQSFEVPSVTTAKHRYARVSPKTKTWKTSTQSVEVASSAEGPVSSKQPNTSRTYVISDYTIGTAKYKTANRTDEQARLFPQLETEIGDRRKRLNADVRDQNSAEYKQDICEKVKKLGLCPDQHYKLLCERILKPFSDRFWDEGCAAPSVKGFKGSVQTAISFV